MAEWVRRYLAEGEAGLEPKKRARNPLLRYQNRKELNFEEQLLYQIELLKRELEYSSVGFSNLLSQYHITQSMSKAGTPRDNAVMENFFGRFKDTLRFHYRYWEKDDLRAVIADCVHYFNYIHPICKSKPPVEVVV